MAGASRTRKYLPKRGRVWYNRSMRAVVSVIGKDRTGIIAAVAGALAERNIKKASYNPRSIRPIVAKSYVTVFTGIMTVLKSLRKKGSVTMEALYNGQPRSRKVATFLAILELSKEGRIIISEDGESVRMATAADRAAAAERADETDKEYAEGR